MHKWNGSPIDTGHGQTPRVGDIMVPKDLWDIARDLFCCRILSEDPYAVHVGELSKESYKEAHKILSTAIKEFEVPKAPINTASIHMFQAQLSSTENEASGWQISCLRALRQTGL